MKSQKQDTLDPVPTFLLRDCVDILLPLVTKLVNLSLTEDVFQPKKKAVVTHTPSPNEASLSNKELSGVKCLSLSSGEPNSLVLLDLATVA